MFLSSGSWIAALGDYGAQLLARCHMQEAPVEWLIGMNLQPMALLSCAVSIGLIIMSWIIWLQGSWHFCLLCFMSGLIVGVFHIILLRCRYRLEPRVVEMIAVSVYSVSSCVLTWAPFFALDHVHRHRAMGMNFILWKSILPFFGYRLKACTTILLLGGINETIATWSTFQKFGDTFPVRIIVVIIVLSIVYLLGVYVQQLRWRTLYDAEVQLTAEKEALESLLSMVCDSIFWLSADCDSVLRSNVKFDAIMGSTMQGSSFSSSMVDSNGFRNSIGNQLDPARSPVTLFPTKLLLGSGQMIDVDLFVVDRRGEFATCSTCHKSTQQCVERSPPSAELGFLVGLRLSNPIAIEPMAPGQGLVMLQQTPAKLSDEQETAAETEVDNEDHAQVVAPTLNSAISPGIEARAPRGVRFSNISGADESLDSVSVTDSMGPQSMSCRRRISAVGCHGTGRQQGPPFGTPFAASGHYLEDCSKSLLEDLLSSWNFNTEGCCAWHAYLRRLRHMTYSMYSLHECADNWKPRVAWQCGTCSALQNEDHPSDCCWLCYEPRANNTSSDQNGCNCADPPNLESTHVASIEKKTE